MKGEEKAKKMAETLLEGQRTPFRTLKEAAEAACDRAHQLGWRNKPHGEPELLALAILTGLWLNTSKGE